MSEQHLDEGGSFLQRIQSSPSWEYSLLFLIVALAAMMRLFKLGAWSFWGDEMFTLRDVEAASEGFTKVSTLLINVVLEHYNTSEWSARLVPAVIGIVTIPLLHLAIRKTFDPLVALIASLFLAVSPWHLYWSQNARFYSVLLLFYSLALFTFYFAHVQRRPFYFLLSSVFVILAVRERLTALFLIPILAGYLLWLLLGRVNWLKTAIKSRRLVSVGLLLPLVSVYLVWQYWTAIPFLPAVNHGWVNSNPFWIVTGAVYYMGLPVFCMGLVGLGFLWFHNTRGFFFWGLAALIPLVSVALLSLLMYTANRYIFVSLTAWILLAALATKELLTTSRGNTRLLTAGVLLVLVLAPLSDDFLYYFYQNGNRDDWRAAFQKIRDEKRPGDLVVTPNLRLAHYYLKEPTIPMSSTGTDQLNKAEQRVWFVEDFTARERWPAVQTWIVKNTRLVGVFDVSVKARNFRMRVYLYDPADKATEGIGS